MFPQYQTLQHSPQKKTHQEQEATVNMEVRSGHNGSRSSVRAFPLAKLSSRMASPRVKDWRLESEATQNRSGIIFVFIARQSWSKSVEAKCQRREEVRGRAHFVPNLGSCLPC